MILANDPRGYAITFCPLRTGVSVIMILELTKSFLKITTVYSNNFLLHTFFQTDLNHKSFPRQCAREVVVKYSHTLQGSFLRVCEIYSCVLQLRQTFPSGGLPSSAHKLLPQIFINRASQQWWQREMKV